MRTGRHGHGGFIYVALLVGVAMIGIAASASLSLGATMARRDAERQMLTVGLELQQALRSYAGVPLAPTIPVTGTGPRNLDDLLKDQRVAGIRRHLRQLYVDPMTGRADWALVRNAQGFIVGVHSLAQGRPIQRSGFAPTLPGFEEADSYRQWVFGLAQAQRPPAPAR